MATPLQGGYEYQHYCYFYPDIINLQGVRADLEGPPAACRVVTERQSVFAGLPSFTHSRAGSGHPVLGFHQNRHQLANLGRVLLQRGALATSDLLKIEDP